MSLKDDIACKVKPTFEHEVIPLQSGGAMLIIYDFEVEITDPHKDCYDGVTDKYADKIKRYIREKLK